KREHARTPLCRAFCGWICAGRRPSAELRWTGLEVRPLLKVSSSHWHRGRMQSSFLDEKQSPGTFVKSRALSFSLEGLLSSFSKVTQIAVRSASTNNITQIPFRNNGLSE